MIGALAGDMIGSIYEFANTSSYSFPLFSKWSTYTDDSICTVAVADAILRSVPYGTSLVGWCSRYPSPMGGYGTSFGYWVRMGGGPSYGSYGNGSAMRVSAIGWAFDSEKEILSAAKESAEVTHSHPEGIRGAQAVALAIFLLRKDPSKESILKAGERFYPHFMEREYPHSFDETCQGTVPLCLYLASTSSSFEDAIRRAVSWGGDSDTMGAIVGAIAEALWGVPGSIREETIRRLDPPMAKVVEKFEGKYGCGRKPEI